MAISKKSSIKKSSAHKTAATKSPKPGPSQHIQQIDGGWYNMYQGACLVGQVVVTGSGANTTEYYFLYQSGCPTGQGPYSKPGPNNSPVTTKYTYMGTLPPGWSTPAKYQSSLYPVIAQLVTAVCTTAATKKKPAAARKKK